MKIFARVAQAGLIHMFGHRSGTMDRKSATFTYQALVVSAILGGLACVCHPRELMARPIPGSTLTPTVWWDANAGNNVVAGGGVTQLTDQSGNGNNAVLAGSTAPILITNAVNGLSTLSFNGGSALVSPTGATTGNASHSIFVAAKFVPGISGSFRNGAVFYSGTATPNRNSAIGVDPASGDLWIGGFSQDSAPYLSAASLTNGQYSVLAKIYNGSSQTYTGYINTNTSISVISGGAAYNLGGTDVGIGRQYDSGGYWGGEIAEVVIFNSVLSVTDTMTVENYLSTKYNAPISGLAIQLVGTNRVQLTWTTAGGNYELQSSTNVDGPYAYSGLTITNMGQTNLTLDTATDASRFYRLQSVTNAQPIPVVAVQSDPDGATLQMNPGTLKIQVFAPGIIRIAYGLSNAVPAWTNSLAVIKGPVNGTWPLTITDSTVQLTTGLLQVRVNRASGAVGFYDTNGWPLLSEKADGGKTLSPTTINGVSTLQSKQQFVIAEGEAFYGLGQHQSGIMNYAGTAVHLQQQNPGESDVPVLISSRGYGVLWDNPAITDVNLGSSGDFNPIPSSQLYSTNGLSGGLNGYYYSGTSFNTFLFTRVDPQVNFVRTSMPPTNTMNLTNYSVEWDGLIKAEAAGTYRIAVNTDDGVRLWIDGQQLVDDWTARPAKSYVFVMNWATNSLHSVRMQYFQNAYDAIAQLSWQVPSSSVTPEASWTSQSAPA